MVYRIADLFVSGWKKHTAGVESFRCAQWECLARKRENVGRKYPNGRVQRGIRIRESLQCQTTKSLTELSASSTAVREFFCDIKPLDANQRFLQWKKIIDKKLLLYVRLTRAKLFVFVFSLLIQVIYIHKEYYIHTSILYLG